MNVRAVAQQIRALGLTGFGGECGAAAIEINHKVFGGRGRYVAGVNDALLEQGRAMGHVAVLFGGHYWDADGHVEESDLLGWGMLDAQEWPEFFPEGAEELADAAVLIELESDAEVLQYFPSCQVRSSKATKKKRRSR